MAPEREPDCDPKDVALKSLFLGPQAENGEWLVGLVSRMLGSWFDSRRSFRPSDGRAISEQDIALPEFSSRRAAFESALGELSSRLAGEVPKFSPRYIGHMFSEVSLPALLGHVAALLQNPNNISGESARVAVQIEDEAIAALAGMLGFAQGEARGHFTSGGTVANYEALVRARGRCARNLAAGASRRRRGDGSASLFDCAHRDAEGEEAPASLDFTRGNPYEVAEALAREFGVPFRGPVILVPENKHYSWLKATSLLGLGDEAFWGVPLDREGRLSVPALERRIDQARRDSRPIALVVSVAGTTELGSIDPIDEVAALLERQRRQRGHAIWHHVDAAYGGFFRALGKTAADCLDARSARALAAIGRADSVTIDPHKLGYVPYSSGAFIARSPAEYGSRAFGAAYVQFESTRDKGPYTLEGSRSAAGAAATWMIERALGLNDEGHGRILARTVRIRRELEARLRESGLSVRIAPGGDTNILAFCLARPGDRLSEANARTEAMTEALGPAAHGPFILSRTTLARAAYGTYLDEFLASWSAVPDADRLVLARVCLMNPFFGSREMSTDFAEELLRAIARLGGAR